MKNLETFEQELSAAERGESGGAEIAALRSTLANLATEQERSGQQQAWAWTRLREELRQPEKPGLMTWLLRPMVLGGALAVLGLLVVAGLRLGGDGQDLWVNVTNPSLHAQTFKSGEAEVIWVTGYPYIPSSTQLR
ncbi:MAG: hypothetical protein HC904_11070 [Blastochloris sp.]|nr:hypothetical protein [Blastochloris sp.]